MFTLWNFLTLLAFITLLISFFIRGRNSIWGALTLGLIIGIILGVISYVKGLGFGWDSFKKAIVISIILGGFFELIGRLSILRKSGK